MLCTTVKRSFNYFGNFNQISRERERGGGRGGQASSNPIEPDISDRDATSVHGFGVGRNGRRWRQPIASLIRPTRVREMVACIDYPRE